MVIIEGVAAVAGACAISAAAIGCYLGMLSMLPHRGTPKNLRTVVVPPTHMQ